MYSIKRVLLRNNRQWKVIDFANTLVVNATITNLTNRLTNPLNVVYYKNILDYFDVNGLSTLGLPVNQPLLNLINWMNVLDYTTLRSIEVSYTSNGGFPDLVALNNIRTSIHNLYPSITDAQIDSLYADVELDPWGFQIALNAYQTLGITLSLFVQITSDIINLGNTIVKSIIKTVDPSAYPFIIASSIIDNILISSLIKDNSHIVIELIDASLNITKQFNLFDFPNIRKLDPTTRLHDYFYSYNGYLPLEITPKLNPLNPKKVTYHDLFIFGLDAERTINDNSVIVRNPNHLPDIKLSRKPHFPNSFQSLSTKVLYTLNGSIVFPTIVNDTALIDHGAVILDRFKEQHLGVIDFSQIGDFQLVRFNDQNTMIVSQANHKVIVKTTLVGNLKNYTVLLILDGRLHVLNNRYEILSSTEIGIRLDYFSMIDGLKNTNVKTITWINAVDNLGNGYDLSTIDPLKYLTDTYSGILLLPTTALCIKETSLQRTGFVGRFGASEVPTGIVFLEDGTIGDYLVTEVTHYGHEVAVSKPKLLNDLKRTLVEPIGDTPNPNYYRNVMGINNGSLTLPARPYMARVVDLYTI